MRRRMAIDQPMTREPIGRELTPSELAEGRVDEAAATYQAALGIAPDNPRALNNLACLYTDVLAKPAQVLILLHRVDSKVLSGLAHARHPRLGAAQGRRPRGGRGDIGQGRRRAARGGDHAVTLRRSAARHGA